MYGGHLITPTWATRSAGGDRAAFEAPELYEPLRLYMDFFRRHEPLYEDVRSLANVGILRSRGSLTLDFFNSYPCVVGMEQVCLQHQIPFDIVFSFALNKLDKYDALLLAEQTCLSDPEIETIKRFVAKGGGLVITGRTGIYDERFRHRRSHPFEALLGHSRVVSMPDNPERLGKPDRDHPPAYHDMRLPARSEEIAAAILRATGGRLPYRVEAGRFVGTDGYQVISGARVIHLLNYDNESPSAPVAITLSDELATPQALLISPDVRPEERAIRAGGNRFEIGCLDTYAALVLSSK